MPIIELQRRLVQVGRIRMGASEPTASGGKLPKRLGNWRLTSRDKQRLQEAAALYGGQVIAWDGHAGEYVLDTETDTLPIAVLPGQNLSIWLELWGQRGRAKRAPIECLRRCDGETETLTDSPCMCDPEKRDCKPRTRLSVLLTEVPGIGCWRFDSAGWNAARELSGTTELLEQCTAAGMPYPARLRIDQRRGVKDGQTVAFPVPVLDIATTLGEALATLGEGHAASPRKPELSPGHTPIEQPNGGGTSLQAGLDAAKRLSAPAAVSARSAAPIGPAFVGPTTSTSPIPVSAPDGGVHFPPATAAATAVSPPDQPVPNGGEASPTAAAADTSGEDTPLPEQDESLFDDLPGQLAEKFPKDLFIPSGEDARHSVAAATKDQLNALNALVGQLRRDELITTEMVWRSVAVDRGENWENMAAILGGWDDDNVLHWSPLRDSLSFAEASDLIDRLGTYADAHKEDK